MYNKKNGTGKVVGVAVGSVAGIVAIATGAYLLYKHFMDKKVIGCDDCEMCSECVCRRKYADACYTQGDCLVEEGVKFEAAEFENAVEVV